MSTAASAGFVPVRVVLEVVLVLVVDEYVEVGSKAIQRSASENGAVSGAQRVAGSSHIMEAGSRCFRRFKRQP